jgi:hypothetical protein
VAGVALFFLKPKQYSIVAKPMSYRNLNLNNVNMHWSGLNRNKTQGFLFTEPN